MRSPLIGGKDSKLPLDKEDKLKEGSWEVYPKEGVDFVCFFRGKKEENECVRKISSYV
jgi:hypothetical protein